MNEDMLAEYTSRNAWRSASWKSTTSTSDRCRTTCCSVRGSPTTSSPRWRRRRRSPSASTILRRLRGHVRTARHFRHLPERAREATATENCRLAGGCSASSALSGCARGAARAADAAQPQVFEWTLVHGPGVCRAPEPGAPFAERIETIRRAPAITVAARGGAAPSTCSTPCGRRSAGRGASGAARSPRPCTSRPCPSA